MSKYKIDAVYGYLSRHRGSLCPIGTACLAEAADLLKNSYFKVLAAVLHHGSVITSEQREFFERSITEAGCACSSCDYFRQGLDIQQKDFVDLAEQCSGSPLRYRLALDAIVLSGLGGRSRPQESVVGILMECLHFRKNETEYLIQLAESVLAEGCEACQNTEGCEVCQSAEGTHSIAALASSGAASEFPGSQPTGSGTGGYGIELIGGKGPVKP